MLGLPTEFVAPRSSTEKQVARIWCEAFGLDEVGINDDFFELSGDSLTATTIATVISSDFNAKFRPGMLMTCSTVSKVAEYLQKMSSAQGVEAVQRDWPVHLVPVRTEGSLIPLFVIHGGFGISFPRKSFIEGLSSDQPLYFIQAIGYMGEASPPDSVVAIAARYLETMRLVQPEGALNIASFCAGGMIAVEIARLLSSAGDPPAHLILVDPPVPFTLRPHHLPPSLRITAYRVRAWGRRVREALGLRFDNSVAENLARYGQRHPTAGSYELEVVKKARERLKDAFISYLPQRFNGHVDVLASQYRGKNLGEGSVWRDTLPHMTLHIIGDTHMDLLKTNAGETARRLQLILTGKAEV